MKKLIIAAVITAASLSAASSLQASPSSGNYWPGSGGSNGNSSYGRYASHYHHRYNWRKSKPGQRQQGSGADTQTGADNQNSDDQSFHPTVVPADNPPQETQASQNGSAQQWQRRTWRYRQQMRNTRSRTYRGNRG